MKDDNLQYQAILRVIWVDFLKSMPRQDRRQVLIRFPYTKFKEETSRELLATNFQSQTLDRHTQAAVFRRDSRKLLV